MSGELDSKAISLSFGLTWALGILVLGAGASFIPGWQSAVDWIARFYVGYNATVPGIIIGVAWGFLDVTIGLYVLTKLYNILHENPGLTTN